MVIIFVAVGLFFWMEWIHEEAVVVSEVEVRNNDEELVQSACEDAGGIWNNCGSACRENPEAVCIQVCVEYCECQTSEQCPNGFVCGDFVEQAGVCKRS